MSTETSSDAAGFGSAPGDKGLKGGALGLVSGVVIGLASTAPAYSLAASLGLIVVIAFIPMYLIAVAYRELNEAEPDRGTTFTWAGRTFGPWMGWRDLRAPAVRAAGRRTAGAGRVRRGRAGRGLRGRRLRGLDRAEHRPAVAERAGRLRHHRRHPHRRVPPPGPGHRRRRVRGVDVAAR